MHRCRTRTILALAAFWGLAPAAPAQQPAARIGYLMPAGGQQGATLLAIVGGRYLEGVAQAFISGSGVDVKVIDYVPPTKRGNANLTTRVQKLAEKPSGKNGKWTPDDDRLLTALTRKLAISQRVPPAPAIGESVLLQITIAADAPPGQRELRVETSKGLTNPMAFWIGELPEAAQEIPLAERTAKDNRPREEARIVPPAPPLEITLPVVVNGQIMPGAADRFRFAAHKGEKLVIAAATRALVPYIADAVPGWFQAALTLHDDQGHELAYADHYQFRPDPVLYYEVPRDGDYVVEIRDSLYRGREDFVYRVAIGEIPFITSIFPLGGPATSQTNVELRGWNLPTTRFAQDAQGAEPGNYLLPLGSAAQVCNPVLFGLDRLPECLESDAPHPTLASAQPITLPIVVNGRIDPPDQADVYRFAGRAGEEIVAEVLARRLGSPLDATLLLTDAGGRPLAYNDDHEDQASGLNTHHADSFVRFTLPADGTYCLHLGDAQHKGGPEYGYRLRVSSPRPDFTLRIVPSSIAGKNGSTIPVTVHAVRRDGFSGEIGLALKGAPEGFVLSRAPSSVDASPADPNVICVPPDQDRVKLTLKVTPSPDGAPVNLKLEGTATVAGHPVSHLAVPAEDMMQAFEYRHLVAAQELKVAVSGRYVPPKPVVKIVSPTPIKIPLGGSARLQLSVSPHSLIERLTLQLRKPPAGIALESVGPTPEGLELVLQTDAQKVKPGLRGNLALTAVAEAPPAEATKDDAAAKSSKSQAAERRQREPAPNVPSIRFEVVAP